MHGLDVNETAIIGTAVASPVLAILSVDLRFALKPIARIAFCGNYFRCHRKSSSLISIAELRHGRLRHHQRHNAH